MALGNLQTEADLDRFLNQRIPPNLDKLLRQLQGILASLVGKAVAFGSVTLTFTAAATSATATVNHGLENAPEGVWLSVDSLALPVEANYGNVGGTSFQVNAHRTDGAAMSGTVAASWLAVG